MGYALIHYLVTGAQGLLGTQVVQTLRAAGGVVTATGRRPMANMACCDLTVVPDVTRMVKQIGPDVIVHCAANVPKRFEEYDDDSNAQASLQMLVAILAASTCPIVFISSMTVYGIQLDRPVSEQDAGNPASAYGRAKWVGEQRLLADGRPALIVRIPGLFSPWRRDGLVYNVIRAAKLGRPPRLPMDSILWAAMHVDDAAESIAKLVASPIDKLETINIGYRGAYSIKTLVSLACDMYDRKVDYPVEQPYFEFDLSRANSRGAVPDCSLRDALAKFGCQI